MPTHPATIFVYNSAGAAFASMMASVFSEVDFVINGTAAVSDPSYDAYGGCACFSYNLTFSTDTYPQIFVIANQEGGTLLNIDQFLAQQGTELRFATQITPLNTLSALEDFWNTYISSWKALLIFQACDVSVAIVDQQITTSLLGAQTVISECSRCEAVQQWFYTRDYFKMYDQAGVTPDHIGLEENPASQGAPLPISPVNIGALVDAVNDISSQDVEASFNQGQTAYSIKAKVTAGP